MELPVTPSRWSSALTLMVAVLLGLTLGIWFVGWDRLAGDIPWWALAGDRLQHMTGANYFIADAWRWPLLDMRGLNEPTGANLVYTDSIPLFALGYKLLQSWLPSGYAYFDLFIVVSFALTAGFFAWALQRGGVTHPGLLLPLAVMGACLPALVFRFGHAALCGHFVLVAGLLLYLSPIRRGWGTGLWFQALLTLALLIHVYLLAMAYAIFLAWVLRRRAERRESRWTPALWLGGSLLLTLLLMLALGHLRPGQIPVPHGRPRVFTMNLLSPFWPAPSGLFPGVPRLDPTRGQYEGYNYLGLGWWLLVGTALWLARRDLRGLLRRHAFLAGTLGVCGLFAIGQRVFFGNQLLISYTLPQLQPLLGNFASAGRFFWPVAYALILFAALRVGRAGAGRELWLTPVLVGVAALQMLDARGAETFRREFRQPSPELARESMQWEACIHAHEQLRIHPLYYTTQSPADRDWINRLVHAASRHGVPVNNAYLARNLQPADAQPLPEVEADLRLPGALVILLRDSYSPEQARSLTPPGSELRVFAGGYAISACWPELEQQGVVDPSVLVAWPARDDRMPPGKAAPFTSRQTGAEPRIARRTRMGVGKKVAESLGGVRTEGLNPAEGYSWY